MFVRDLTMKTEKKLQKFVKDLSELIIRRGSIARGNQLREIRNAAKNMMRDIKSDDMWQYRDIKQKPEKSPCRIESGIWDGRND